MGWSNSGMPWRELEGCLSDRPFAPAPLWTPPPAPTAPRSPVGPPSPVDRAPKDETGPPYAELHCHSHFSFLDGASSPDELVAEAVRLGLSALALTDHDGFYGVVRFAEAARLAEAHYRAGALSLQLFMDAQAGYLEAVDSALLLQEQAVEVGFRLRELSGDPFSPVSIR
mgnify:CR=1 FL=1